MSFCRHLQSYLLEQTLSVICGIDSSASYYILVGVLHGSLLGSVLYLFYTTGILVPAAAGIITATFADNTEILAPVTIQEVIYTLQAATTSITQ